MVANGSNKMKRKHESNEVKIEPKMKALKKNDILVQFAALKLRYEVLEKENRDLIEDKKKDIEVIILLEETVKLLETRSPPVQQMSTEMQTECKDWEILAEKKIDRAIHMNKNNTKDSVEQSIKCYYCEEKFILKTDLLNHRKQAHPEKAQFCIYFSEDKCEHGDLCWYSHIQPVKLPEYECRICEEKFKLKSAFMKHRKKSHRTSVPICKASKNGRCYYDSNNCWFHHEDILANQGDQEIIESMDVDENEQKNGVMLQKLFEMVEKYTQRIILLENEIKNAKENFTTSEQHAN